MNLERQIGQKLLFAFHGKQELSPEIVNAFRQYSPAGVTLFRSMNMGSPAQIRELTGALQRLARELGLPPLLIATDQEGGQLMAVGDGTPLPGNMALGATRSVGLARQAGEVLGQEMAALGINVNYAPCADVNINPQNPVVGTRSFGDDPQWVGELAAAMIVGIQSCGAAATVKHFPGHGDTASDSHHGLASVPHSLERLRSVELPPFRAAIQAQVQLVMTAHLGIPALDGPDAPPATLSRKVISGMLRRELGFKGVVITDAMDMRAIRQGELLREDVLRAVLAGADLLLMTADPQDQARAFEGLLAAARAGSLTPARLNASLARIARLKAWLAGQPPAPDLGVIRSASHLDVARRIAEQAVTLVRDTAGLIPLRPRPEERIAVIIPVPQDLTPADTSSYTIPALADAVRAIHPRVDELRMPLDPGESEIAGLLEGVRGYDWVVIGTINAYNQMGQASLVRAVLGAHPRVILAAMRLPYDAAAFPEAPTVLCTYSILQPAMQAAARAFFGLIPMPGTLPVKIDPSQ